MIADATKAPWSNGKADLHYKIVRSCQAYDEKYVKPARKEAGDYLWGRQKIREITTPSENDYVYNVVHKDHRLAVSMLCRDMPIVKLVPITPSVEPLVEPLTDMCNHILAINNYPTISVEMLNFGLPMAMGFFKMGWEPTMRLGLGDVSILPMDPRNIFFMPGINRVSKSLVISERQQLDKMTALHMFGTTSDNRTAIKEAFKRPATDEAAKGDGYGNFDDSNYQNVNADGFQSRVFMDGVPDATKEKPTIDMWQQWIIDPTALKDIPELYDMVKNKPAYKALPGEAKDAIDNKPLYPRGRVCIFVQDHLLESRINPFPSLPYVQYVNQSLPVMKPGDEMRGGEYEQMYEVQDLINDQLNRDKDKTDAAGTRTFVQGIDEADLEEFQNDPNALVPMGQGGDSKGVTTQGATPEMVNQFNTYVSMAREVQNRSDVSQGQNPSGTRSGDQVTELSNLANRVMVTQNRAYENVTAAVVRYAMWMIGGGFYRPGDHYDESLQLQGLSPDAFEVIITAGINLPATDSQRLPWITTYLQAGVIDKQAALEAAPEAIFPNRRALLERMQQQWQAEQEAAQQQHEAELAQAHGSAQQSAASAQNQVAQANNVVPITQGA